MTAIRNKQPNGGYRNMTDEQLLEALEQRLVRKENGCLEWTGKVNTFGYAQVCIAGRHWMVNRLLWKLRTGLEVPKGIYLCHTCDNPPCADQAHLFLGTMRENILDCMRKGRNHELTRTHCPRGHILAGDNIRYTPTKAGGLSRQCIACQRGHQRVKAGWPVDLAFSTPVLKLCRRPKFSERQRVSG